MNESKQRPSEAESLLRSVLSVQPPPGLEDRLLRRLEQRTRERGVERRPVWPSCFALALTLAIAGIAVEMCFPTRAKVAPPSSKSAIAKSAESELPVPLHVPTSPQRRSASTIHRSRTHRAIMLQLQVAPTSLKPLTSFETPSEQSFAVGDASVPGMPLPGFDRAAPVQPLPKIENASTPGHALPQFAGAVVPGIPLPTFAAATNTGDHP